MGLVRVGGLELENCLGQGSVARVHLAWDPQLRRSVEVQIPRSSTSAKALMREAQSLAAFHHSGLPTIFQIRQDDVITKLGVTAHAALRLMLIADTRPQALTLLGVSTFIAKKALSPDRLHVLLLELVDSVRRRLIARTIHGGHE